MDKTDIVKEDLVHRIKVIDDMKYWFKKYETSGNPVYLEMAKLNGNFSSLLKMIINKYD